jgi:DNA-binding IclR family transcriptional regulator
MASGIGDGPKRSGAESSRKMLRLLTAFDETHHTRAVAELAHEADIPVSSAYRYLAVLRDERLVEEAERGHYRLSVRVVAMARAANAAMNDLVDVARPVLESVVEATGETTLLIRRLGFAAVCVERVESTHPVRLQFDRGHLMSLHQGSAARVLLSAMAAEDRAAYFAETTVARSGALTDAGLDQIRAAGWAESFEEVDEGIWGVSALVEQAGEASMAIGLAAPLFRNGEARRRRAITLVRRAALTVSEALAEPV